MINSRAFQQQDMYWGKFLILEVFPLIMYELRRRNIHTEKTNSIPRSIKTVNNITFSQSMNREVRT